MSHANLTGVTQKGQNMELSFGRVYFLKKIKKETKIQKNAG
jgi:hypothetical protein